MVTPLAPVVARGRALAQDLRLLGAGAPVRAGLELSKRMGGHALVFGRLARQGADPATRRDLVWRDPLPVPSWVTGPQDASAMSIDASLRERTLLEADAITRGHIELFGQRLDLGSDPDWHAAIDDPGRWPLGPWWEIDIRSAARLGDVKWVWELGRHRHLVILARAVALEPDNPRWLDVLHHQLDSWLTANPPEIGIHWYSNLEVALRAIAWCEILGLAGAALPAATRTEMVAALHHSGRHLLADLPYTVSTMRNNHLLGDALGLLVLGSAFPDDHRAARWRRVGERLFTQQLGRQVQADGSQIEDAVSYHRFVLEMVLTRLRLGASGPDVRRAARTSAELLGRLGVFEGPVPRYGDGDEGRVLVSTGPFDDLVGSTVAALLAAGGEDHVPPGIAPATFDEVAWYPLPAVRSPAPPGTDQSRTAATVGADDDEDHDEDHPADAEPTSPLAVLVGGGIVRARMGPLAVWLKAGGHTSHGHADLCSTVVGWFPDERAVWLVGDPGTGTYNGPAVERDHFRSTIAHSALRLEGEDQLVPYRAFRWRHAPTGAAAEPLLEGDAVVLWGWHGAYTRLEPPRRVVRAVVLQPATEPVRDGPDVAALAPDGRRGALRGAAGARVTVIDWVEGPPGAAWALSLPLGPSTTYADGSLHADAAGATFALALPGVPDVHRGEERPFDGWWSSSYGSREPATRLEVRGTVEGPILWQLSPALADPGATRRTTGEISRDRRDGATVVDGDAVVLGHGLRLTAAFEDGCVRLVTATGESVLRTDAPAAG